MAQDHPPGWPADRRGRRSLHPIIRECKKAPSKGAAETFDVIRWRFVAGLWPVRSGGGPTRPATVHRTVAMDYSNLLRMQKTSGTNVPEVFW